jgi:hypothetical protein
MKEKKEPSEPGRGVDDGGRFLDQEPSNDMAGELLTTC